MAKPSDTESPMPLELIGTLGVNNSGKGKDKKRAECLGDNCGTDTRSVRRGRLGNLFTYPTKE